MRRTGSTRQIARSTGNVLGYLATGGRHIPLEGRFRGTRFRNWSKVLRHTPGTVVRPASEAEIRQVVEAAPPVRTVGSGHSFNLGFAAETMVSLDRYAGVDIDTASSTARVKAGTRMRDMSRYLWKHGYALTALASHDAQSIGGLIATDVHGTGATLDAFVSEQVASMRVIDGLGDVHDVEPTDDLFRATVGGVGATGLVTEATFAVVPSFNVEQRTATRDLAEVREDLPQLLAAHDHLSLYVFPFARSCQVNTWDRTELRRSRLATVREAVAISRDAVATSVAGNVLASRGWLPRWSEQALRTQKRSHLVMRSYQGFNRSVYHQHEELEFAVDADGAFDVLAELTARFEAAYRRDRLPFTFFEVRFTPEGHDRTLLSPGRGRESVWIDVLPNETLGFDRFYREVIPFIRTHDGRPHLGKWTDDVGHDDLAAFHGSHFARFLELREKFDPHRRFANPFTTRVFGP